MPTYTLLARFPSIARPPFFPPAPLHSSARVRTHTSQVCTTGSAPAQRQNQNQSQHHRRTLTGMHVSPPAVRVPLQRYRRPPAAVLGSQGAKTPRSQNSRMPKREREQERESETEREKETLRHQDEGRERETRETRDKNEKRRKKRERERHKESTKLPTKPRSRSGRRKRSRCRRQCRFRCHGERNVGPELVCVAG